MKRCIVCEKDLPPIDDKMSDNIEGGTLDIDFGYGSTHDTGISVGGWHTVFQTAICDGCFNKKKHLGEWVGLKQINERTTIEEDEVYGM